MGSSKKAATPAAPAKTSAKKKPSATARGVVIPCKVEDHLRVDPERRGQTFVVLSVLNPESTIADRKVYEFGRFVRSIGADISALLDSLVEHADGKGASFGVPVVAADADADADQDKDSQAAVAMSRSSVADSVRMIRERHAYMWDDNTMQDELRVFCRAHADRITADFDRDHSFATSVRGVNVRGVCETLQEAHKLVEQLKATDTTHSMFIGNVGYWLPLGVHPDDVSESEYAEAQLNTLMKKYVETQAENEVRYDLRKSGLKGRVAADNAAKQAASEAAQAVPTPSALLDALDHGEDAWMTARGTATERCLGL